MRPEKDRSAFAYATRQNHVVLPVVVGVTALIMFALRDGFGWGDVLGAIIIGIGVFVILMVLR